MKWKKKISKDQFIGKIGLALQGQTFVMAYMINLGACVRITSRELFVVSVSRVYRTLCQTCVCEGILVRYNLTICQIRGYEELFVRFLYLNNYLSDSCI